MAWKTPKMIGKHIENKACENIVKEWEWFHTLEGPDTAAIEEDIPNLQQGKKWLHAARRENDSLRAAVSRKVKTS